MESCKLVNTPQVSDEIKARIKGIVGGISDFTKEQLRAEMPDIPQDAIDDLYESHVCKAICVKSESEYVKFRTEGYNRTEATKMAIINELVSLRDKGVLPDDLALENVIRDIKDGVAGGGYKKNASRNLNKAYYKFIRSSEDAKYKRNFQYTCSDAKLAEYYLGIIAKFNMGIAPFIKETMDFYIENHQQELREIERRDNDKTKEEEDKKESVSEKNRRLFG